MNGDVTLLPLYALWCGHGENVLFTLLTLPVSTWAADTQRSIHWIAVDTARCQLCLTYRRVGRRFTEPECSWLRSVKRDKPTRCNQSDVYYQTSISTCFGHRYAHHQENKTVHYCIWCSVLVVWSCVVSSVHCVHTVCTLLTTQLHTTTANLSQHNQYRTPYAVVHGLVLLMMGITMPETCWDRSLIIHIWLVASRWFLSSHYVHDARSQEPKTSSWLRSQKPIPVRPTPSNRFSSHLFLQPISPYSH